MFCVIPFIIKVAYHFVLPDYFMLRCHIEYIRTSGMSFKLLPDKI